MRLDLLRLLRLLLLCAVLSSTTLVRAQDGGDKPPTGMTIHVVQRGENLFRISLRYGTTINVLMALNGIVNPNRIFVGQVLRLP